MNIINKNNLERLTDEHIRLILNELEKNQNIDYIDNNKNNFNINLVSP
jgi:hypothetical protein